MIPSPERIQALVQQCQIPLLHQSEAATLRIACEHAIRQAIRETAEECAKIADSHECGGEDDFICQHQNCALCISGDIRRSSGA